MSIERAERPAGLRLEPLPADPDAVPGRYASVDVSPEPMFGPDQLGGYKSAVEELIRMTAMQDTSARIFEVLQAWEARLFSRGYQFLTNGARGIGLYGGAGAATPSSIMATGNAMKLFPVNVYGAREDKITAALGREVPGLKFMPKDPDSPPDQTAAEEANRYVKVWQLDSDIKSVVARICRYFYTDGRVVLWTRSVADQQRWGAEAPDKDVVFGAGQTEGVTPETEMEGGGAETSEDPAEHGQAGERAADGAEEGDEPAELPAICEITSAYGVLESKVPIYADDIFEMGWVRIATEQDVDILRERYPWVADKIEAGGSAGGDGFDRMARINVRLAVQNSSATGESCMKDATESHTWFRPSQYHAIQDKETRAVFFENFPDGLRVTHAGNQLAFVRNECLDDHIEIRHPRVGDGQNRRSIGANYLPLQKILNQNIGLLVRYFVGCVPRRFAASGPIDVEAINQQTNDPARITPVMLEAGQRIQDITGIENVPTPTTGLMEFVQWLVNGAPEAMDGATPAMFGQGQTGTVGEAALNRDQSLQVFSAPWSQICQGLARSATQAARAAAVNRKTKIRSRTPGQQRLVVELENLRGEALCYAESLEIPQTLVEQEAQTAALVEASTHVELYRAIVNDVQNLPYFAQMPSLSGLHIPGLGAVEKQQGEFELLTSTGPIENPAIAEMEEKIAELQRVIARGQTHPEAQTAQGQEALAQLQQQLPQLQSQLQQVKSSQPLVSSVPVAQDGSENHAVEAAITLAKLNSAEGRKFKNGTPEQQAVYQNLLLHWRQHEAMAAELTPVQPLPVKASATVAVDKLPPNVQAEALTALGVAAKPEDFVPQTQMVPHETTVEQIGIDPNGAPVKVKTSTINRAGRLR
ncbi:MAG: hypothetical protein ACP5E5_11545 [Acidobacteriaceae bacterium]